MTAARERRDTSQGEDRVFPTLLSTVQTTIELVVYNEYDINKTISQTTLHFKSSEAEERWMPVQNYFDLTVPSPCNGSSERISRSLSDSQSIRALFYILVKLAL